MSELILHKDYFFLHLQFSNDGDSDLGLKKATDGERDLS